LSACLPAALLTLKYFGFNGLIAALAAGAAAATYAKGPKAGVTVERTKQQQVDTRAGDVIHQKKEDVCSIPPTSAGKAERNEGFDRWSK
jgi:hypothetical protein